MAELDERVVHLEAASENTAARVLTLERDVAGLKHPGATKADVVEAKAELAVVIAEATAGILVKVAEAESRLKTEIGATESKLRTEIGATESKLRTEIGAAENRLRTEIGATENRLRTEIVEVKSALESKLRTEIDKTRLSLIRWVVSSVLLAVLLPVLVKQLGF